MMLKVKKIYLYNALCFALLNMSTSSFAAGNSEKNYEGICREIYPNICKNNTCNNEELKEFNQFHNFCVKLVSEDNFIDKLRVKVNNIDRRVISNEKEETLKKDILNIKKEIDSAEEEILVNAKTLLKYTQIDKEINLKINKKTKLSEKEMYLSNYKSFFVFLLKNNNLQNYRKFYNEQIKVSKEDGIKENGVSDFRNKILNKQECVMLVFHTLKTYSLNDGVDALKEVTAMLNEQNIKCK